MINDYALGSATAASPGIPLEEFRELADNQFAMAWYNRYQAWRIRQIPDVLRWGKILRYFHPRKLEDQWQDQFGVPLAKLSDSGGLDVTIWNYCRPIIEVYGSLLAGQKPLPFTIDVKAADTTSKAEIFRADAQEKVILREMDNQRIPLQFLDFVTSVVMFGIGYVFSWIDDKDRRLRTQAISWPGDILVQWGSDAYARGFEEGIESVIHTERIPIDTATRLYGDKFAPSWPDMTTRPDGTQELLPGGVAQLLKIWYRWAEGDDADDGNGQISGNHEQKIGYAVVCVTGTRDGAPVVLYREDDTGYPDIPFRWAARFQTPGEPPHKAAGVLDDIIGINTVYNERLSAFADLLNKFVYPKLQGKGWNINNVPRLDGGNVIPMTLQQELKLVQEIVSGGQQYFDSFLNRLERFMFTSSGLSQLMMGSVPPGETSGDALEQLLHASIGRLEVVRTPIQWAWLSLIQDIWVPLLYKYGEYQTKDLLTGKAKRVDMRTLFDRFSGLTWTWPDVTPRDALKAIQVAMELNERHLLSDESTMGRAAISSPVDELEKIRQDLQDPIRHPDTKRMTLEVQQMEAATQGGGGSGVKVALSGKLTQPETDAAAKMAGIQGVPSTAASTGPSNPAATVDMANKAGPQGSTMTPADNGRPLLPKMQPMVPARGGSVKNAAQGAAGGTPGVAQSKQLSRGLRK